MGLYELLGIVSALVTLFAFVCNEYGIMTSEDFRYDFLNFISSIGLLIFAVHTGALPFILTNSVWGIVSGIDVLKYLLRSKRKRAK